MRYEEDTRDGFFFRRENTVCVPMKKKKKILFTLLIISFHYYFVLWLQEWSWNLRRQQSGGYTWAKLRCPPFHNSMIVIYPSWTALRLSPTYTCSWKAKINPNKQTNWIEIGTLQNVCSCKIKMLDVQEAHLGQNTERGGPSVPDPLANKSCQR